MSSAPRIRGLALVVITIGVAACTNGDAKEAPARDGTTARAASSAPSERLVASGTRVSATLESGLSSNVNKSGETVRASVSADVSDGRGHVLIPAGSIVTLTIDKLEPGSDQIRPEGRLWLNVTSIAVRGQSYPLSATLDPVPHHMKGRGITSDEALRIGAGTAVGAAVGQVIGKDTRSTVIGGAVGAIAGTAVAVRYAYRDIIVPVGTSVVFTLTQPLHVAAP